MPPAISSYAGVCTPEEITIAAAHLTVTLEWLPRTIGGRVLPGRLSAIR